MTPCDQERRLRLCQANGWCQSIDTAWDSERGKWVCRDCDARAQQEQNMLHKLPAQDKVLWSY